MQKKTNLHKRYDEQPSPKARYSTFWRRVKRQWLAKEQAIDPTIQKYKVWIRTNKQLRDFYDSYEWAKVCYSRFIEMYNVCKDEYKAIKHWTITIIDRYPNEYEIYKKYSQPKCSFSQFMIRYKLWKSLDECARATNWARPWWLYKYTTHAEAKKQKYKWDNYLIEITYSKDEAIVFRNVYLKMIDELEYEMLDCTPQRDHEIKLQLQQLTHELEIFNIYNPI